MTLDWNARARVQMRDGKIMDDDTQRIYDVREAITAIPWTTARQYPPPHQYAIFGLSPVAWQRFARYC